MNQKRKISNKINYLELSQLGTAFNLSFSSYELLGNKIIALDGLKRKLLVADENNGLKNPFIIDLSTVLAISVKQIYSAIKTGDLKRRKIEEFLEWIGLEFDFGNPKETILVPVYESKPGKADSILNLERKTRTWQAMLSKIAKPFKKRKAFIVLPHNNDRFSRRKGAIKFDEISVRNESYYNYHIVFINANINNWSPCNNGRTEKTKSKKEFGKYYP